MAVVTVTVISGVSTVPFVRLMRFGVMRNTFDIGLLDYSAAGLTWRPFVGIRYAKDVRLLCSTSLYIRYRQTPYERT